MPVRQPKHASNGKSDCQAKTLNSEYNQYALSVSEATANGDERSLVASSGDVGHRCTHVGEGSGNVGKEGPATVLSRSRPSTYDCNSHLPHIAESVQVFFCRFIPSFFAVLSYCFEPR